MPPDLSAKPTIKLHRPMAWARRALDLLLPPTCLGCRTVVDAAGALCPDCWRAVSFLAPPWCEM